MPISPAARRLVLERAGGRCEYCQIIGWPLTIDHATPRSSRDRLASGADPPHDLDHPDNLVAACAPCNRSKWDRMSASGPLTGLRHPLFNPRVHAWDDHFAWADDFLRIVGLSEIGRVTVAQLRINRTVYQHQRRLLRAAARGGAPPWP